MVEKLASEEKNWAVLTHLSALSIFIGIPFGNIIGPLVMWLIKKDVFPFVDEQGKEALNFQISMTIYILISAILIVVLIGFILLPLCLICDLVFTIIAALKASDGEHYRYPLTIRFLK